MIGGFSEWKLESFCCRIVSHHQSSYWIIHSQARPPLCSFSRYLVISSAVPYGASQTKYGWIFALALYFVDGDMEGNFTVNEQYHPLKSWTRGESPLQSNRYSSTRILVLWCVRRSVCCREAQRFGLWSKISHGKCLLWVPDWSARSPLPVGR